jgi:hypothetical protein
VEAALWKIQPVPRVWKKEANFVPTPCGEKNVAVSRFFRLFHKKFPYGYYYDHIYPVLPKGNKFRTGAKSSPSGLLSLFVWKDSIPIHAFPYPHPRNETYKFTLS